MIIRWLHVSDVHESNRKGQFRRRMYAEIVGEAKRRHPAPDVVFLTGDFAFAGTAEEYRVLLEEFISPLKQVLPDSCPLFTIPGNHDIDRRRSIKPRLWISDPSEAKAFQSIDATGAAKRKDVLRPRFEAYAEFDRQVSAWGSDWLDSEAGAAWWTGEINGAKIVVVGINTAWLCQDDEDWGKLTPGRYMLENALDEARKQKPDVLIVLGHHPVEALMGEGEQSDGLRVRERLKQANALYLHGHLHASGSDRIGNALRSTLTIQAPSAFQAHDSPRWRNGLMWAEADLSTGQLIIEPRLWNEDKREYKWDVDCGYETGRAPDRRDGFCLPLPNRATSAPAPTGEELRPEPEPVDLPPGWREMDRTALAQIRAQPPAAATMVAFFDGIMPTWQLVLARGVRPRAVAERLATRLRAVHDAAPKPSVVLLAGAGGEGKSTAVLQAAAILVEDEDQTWTCLHRYAAAAPLPDDLFARLRAIPGNAWVVVIDDADTVGPAILAALQRLAPRTDVHRLLAARDAEWQMKRLVPGLWEPIAHFQPEPLAGLDEGDARRIVAGWHAWGDEAMGKLRGSSEAQAAGVLLGHAHDFAARKEEGALLGALLITRQGEDLRAHVRTLLHGLGRDPVIKTFSLRDVYTMVAAMHAENQLYLSRSVLAYALGCDVEELERKALDVLRREAMLDPGDTYVLTRHRRIAEAACAVLRDDGDDVDRWYPFLARAAIRDFKVNFTRDPDIGKWNTGLAEYFVAKGERWWTVARAVAKAVYDAEPEKWHGLTTYSSVLRETKRAPEAMAVLKTAGERFRGRREVLYEWGTVAGAVGDQGLSAWLDGRSMADGGEPLTPKNCKLALAGLGVAFRELFAASGNRAFATAQAACGQAGLRLPELEAKARGYFKKSIAEGRDDNRDLSPEQAVAAIRKAVILGAQEVEPDHDPVFFENLLGDPEGYRYSALSLLVGGSTARK